MTNTRSSLACPRLARCAWKAVFENRESWMAGVADSRSVAQKGLRRTPDRLRAHSLGFGLSRQRRVSTKVVNCPSSALIRESLESSVATKMTSDPGALESVTGCTPPAGEGRMVPQTLLPSALLYLKTLL